MKEPILTVNNLKTQFVLGNEVVTVVNGISFKMYPGKTLAIVGESGCGKTVTALSIMRILPKPPALPSQGEVIYQGRNLLNISEREMRKIRGARLSMVFQDPASSLNPVYTIGDQLLEVLDLHLKLYGEQAIERVLAMLDEVGIAKPLDCLKAYPHQLSGGMKQRVMIAMALICEPDILIADEPTTALDVTIQAQILKLIQKLQQRRNMAVLLITHDIGIVSEVADEVLIMYAADVMESGSVSQVFKHKAHPYTLGLFNSRPSLDTPRGFLKAIPGNVPSPIDYPSGCKFHPRCPFVMEKCRVGVIPDFLINDKNGQLEERKEIKTEDQKLHMVKCLLYEDQAQI